MLSLFGYDHAIRNLYGVCVATIGPRSVVSLEELRSAYFDALARLAPALPIMTGPDPFVTDPDRERLLCGFFSASALDDLRQDQVIGAPYSETVRLERIEKVKAALRILEFRSPAASNVFRLMVHSIVVRSAIELPERRLPRGGTTSLAPGVIWLAVHDHESTEDLLEILIHELTHLMLFNDEIVHPQFHYGLIKLRENFSQSAILLGKRPLDKVIHSMVVGTEVILARQFGIAGSHLGSNAHPSSERIAAGVVDASAGVLRLTGSRYVATDHAREIMDACVARCQTFIDAKVRA